MKEKTLRYYEWQDLKAYFCNKLKITEEEFDKDNLLNLWEEVAFERCPENELKLHYLWAMQEHIVDADYGHVFLDPIKSLIEDIDSDEIYIKY